MSENEAQELRTEIKGLEERLNNRFEQSEKQREDRFNQIEEHFDEKFKKIGKQLAKMDSRWEKIDESLRGNGKTGINGRLYSLETLKPFFMWAIGITATGFVGILVAIITITVKLAKFVSLFLQPSGFGSAVFFKSG